MIWAWHHLEGGRRSTTCPSVPEFDDDRIGPSRSCREYVVATCCQEMAENNHDFAHFLYVHGSRRHPLGHEEFVTDDPYKRAEAPSGSFIRETFGLGLGVLRMPDTFVFISSTTPIDEEHVHVRWIFVTPTVSRAPTRAQTLGDVFLTGVSQDIPIWENKAYVPRPVLAKEESGILAHRKWSEQFYSDPSKAID